MHIIDIIPLALIPRNQTQILSYFHGEELPRGSVVEAALGNRKIKGIVIGSDTIKSRKLTFKKEVGFKLKNINKVFSHMPEVSDRQIQLAQFISSYYYAPLGICVKTILPPFWGKRGYPSTSSGQAPSTQDESSRVSHIPKIEFKTGNLKDHYKDYEKEIEQIIKSGKQVFLMVPEKESADYFSEKFKKFNPTVISSKLSNKQYYEAWQKVIKNETRLIIGSRVGLFLPYQDLSLIIIDNESNEFYKSDMMPRYNAVELAPEIARIHESDVLLCDTAPRLETYDSHQRSVENQGFSAIVVNMISEIKNANYSIFSRELKEQILDNRDRIVIYIPRRGHANFILCQHCGQTIKCPNCSISLVLHKNQIDHRTSLLCHHCNQQQVEPKSCPHCNSYKLKAHGVGTEKVIDELKKLQKYNNVKFNVFQLDSDISKNISEQETKILQEFQNNTPSVLVVTQIIFSHKYLINIPIIGIINADALINIPDFRAEESLFRQIYTLGQMSNKLIIQTYNPEDEAIRFASSGDMRGFFDKELANRETFSYPPFSNLVKLSYRHKDSIKARSEARMVFEKLKIAANQTGNTTSIMGPSLAFISRERGEYAWNIVLKIKNPAKFSGENYGAGRNELLRYVPGGWTIDVSPKNTI